jgi:hypothetical protein
VAIRPTVRPVSLAVLSTAFFAVPTGPEPFDFLDVDFCFADFRRDLDFVEFALELLVEPRERA